MRDLTLAFLAFGLFIRQISNIFLTNIDLWYLIIVGLYAVVVNVLYKKTKWKRISYFMEIVEFVLLIGMSLFFVFLAPVLSNLGAKIVYLMVSVLIIFASLNTLILVIKDGKKLFNDREKSY